MILFDEFKAWAAVNAGTIFAAMSGAVIQVAIGWQSLRVAAKHMIVCPLVGVSFGPGLYDSYALVSPVTGARIEFAIVCMVGLGGVWAAEGLNLLWQKWRTNPDLSFLFFWRKS
jgi:hypothetical protein